MKSIPFSESELEVIGTHPLGGFIKREAVIFNTPVNPVDNYIAFAKGEGALWMPDDDMLGFYPAVLPDNIARGAVCEALQDAPKGGKDMFGIDWIYMPEAGGSMVKPGAPLFEDANDWKERVKFPDIESWDWEGCAERNKEFLSDKRVPVEVTIFTGYFERLLSFMDFENAALAVVDEDQTDALAELFDALTDLYIRMIDKIHQYFHPAAILFHDDWGSQMAPFFSKRVFRELILPYMQRLTAHTHELGMVFELHSCGHTESMIEEIIETGADMWWPQPMNNVEELFDKYGDRIRFGLAPRGAKADDPEEVQIKAAREMVERFCRDGKTVWTGKLAQGLAFRKELYAASRKALSGEN